MTTLQQLQALSDDQLIEKVAVEVMGWRCKRFWPVSDMRQDRSKPCETWYNAEGQLQNGPPRFLTDWNHTMEVVERMTSGPQPYRFRINRTYDTFIVEFYKPFRRGKPVANEYWRKHPSYPSEQRVICLAALLALQP